ncbi:DUF927 domain-containing protein, partial [Beijerinckia sp. L45]|uniref:DUF927 domain-containing protein n=1 Tax=Beijerinckia sp. L45 TaxID=1641855 RepID=UPI001AED6A80
MNRTTSRKLLLKNRADVSGLDHCRGELIVATQSDAPVTHRAGHTGWRDAGKRYVTHREVVGAEDGSVLPPPLSALAQNLDLRGTLQGWKDLINVALEHRRDGFVSSLCCTALVVIKLLELRTLYLR